MAILDRLRRELRARRPREEAWRRELPSEVAFWDRWLATGGLEWPWTYEQRLAPDAELAEPLLAERLARLGGPVVRVLDVGAGPVTSLGRRWAGGRLEVTAIDPLADAYDELLDRHGVTPPVRTLAVRGEDLLDRFGTDAFDVAYARNALDHAVDPLRAVEQMLAVVRPGGLVALRHHRNEAERESYTGLHGWNFDVRDGRLIVWRRGAEHDVTAMARAAGAETEAWCEDGYALAALWRAAT